MLFNSLQYLFFLVIVLILYFSFNPKNRWLVLFSSSCFFYMYFIPKYILCLFFLIIIDFFAAKRIYSTDKLRTKKIILFISIFSNFGLLFYFKYFGFFTENLNIILFEIFGKNIEVPSIILPIGLSFHTFQSVGYVIDVYKKRIKPETHIGIYSSYVLFFPQMVAGPIERYSGLGNELHKEQSFQIDNLKKAFPLLLMGYFYKMVIADNCGEYVNSVYSEFFNNQETNVVLAVFLFCIQIYSDFFGYSLIAQGSALLFGIKLIDNFSFPLFSENIIVFWKKWHISLTGWFRDYIYIPIGGNKGVRYKHCFNIILVFSLSGLWHGAGFNFIIWGFLHSIVYLVVYYFFKHAKFKIPKALSYLSTFILVSFIFVFFRNGSFKESYGIIQNILSLDHFSHLKPISFFLILNILAIFLIEYNAKNQINYSNYFSTNTKTKNFLIFSYILFALFTFSGIDNLPFIYFQF